MNVVPQGTTQIGDEFDARFIVETTVVRATLPCHGHIDNCHPSGITDSILNGSIVSPCT